MPLFYCFQNSHLVQPPTIAIYRTPPVFASFIIMAAGGLKILVVLNDVEEEVHVC